jgi:hypothetical protein
MMGCTLRKCLSTLCQLEQFLRKTRCERDRLLYTEALPPRATAAQELKTEIYFVRVLSFKGLAFSFRSESRWDVLIYRRGGLLP